MSELFSDKSKVRLRGLNEFQNQIIKITENYKEMFPAEYRAVVNYLEERRKNLKTNFAELKESKGGSNTPELIERAIHEIPVTLEKMFQVSLSIEGLMWFRTKEGSRWFANEYREFLCGTKL